MSSGLLVYLKLPYLQIYFLQASNLFNKLRVIYKKYITFFICFPLMLFFISNSLKMI